MYCNLKKVLYLVEAYDQLTDAFLNVYKRITAHSDLQNVRTIYGKVNVMKKEGIAGLVIVV
jgi:hypothetical protein